jgi:hypothetical protein
MGQRRYARSGVFEVSRQLARAIDFITFLLLQSSRGLIPPFAHLRKAVFVELGPGPTKFAFLKRKVFAEVHFLDQDEFGKPDPNLRICNLETCDSVEGILSLLGIEADKPVFFFADHCLEHLSDEVVLGLLRSIKRMRYSACFRVPNVMSTVGLKNFKGDPTHRTAFSEDLREKISGWGFRLIPWIRWYRLQVPALSKEAKMVRAEEIALCYNGESN